jgi:hypothetical protein
MVDNIGCFAYFTSFIGILLALWGRRFSNFVFPASQKQYILKCVCFLVMSRGFVVSIVLGLYNQYIFIAE